MWENTRKPIGWECRDHIVFNNTVRAQLNGSSGFFGQESQFRDNPSFALYIYTDGSAREVSRTQKCVGRGFAAMTKRPRNRWSRPVDLCKLARVWVPHRCHKSYEQHRGDAGRHRDTLLTGHVRGTWDSPLHADNDVLITVDSLHVKGLIDEKFIARETRVLATMLCHMWKVTKQRIRLHTRWIRGHSGDVGNGIADRLADAGTRQESQHRWWRRCPLLGGWDEEGFIKKVVSIQRETTVCQQDLETRWTGPTDFPRTDTASHKMVPALGTLTPWPNQPSHGEQRRVGKQLQNKVSKPWLRGSHSMPNSRKHSRNVR